MGRGVATQDCERLIRKLVLPHVMTSQFFIMISVLLRGWGKHNG